MWNEHARLCGNCRFWPLGPYQGDHPGAMPLGLGGYATDGSVSECRRHAPKEVGRDSPGVTRRFPQTAREDWCGDFERRVV